MTASILWMKLKLISYIHANADYRHFPERNNDISQTLIKMPSSWIPPPRAERSEEHQAWEYSLLLVLSHINISITPFDSIGNEMNSLVVLVHHFELRRVP